MRKRLPGAMVARLTPNLKVECSNHVGVIYYVTENRNRRHGLTLNITCGKGISFALSVERIALCVLVSDVFSDLYWRIFTLKIRVWTEKDNFAISFHLSPRID